MVADRGVSWKEASSLAQQAANRKGNGFYRSKREQYHRHLYLLALQKESGSYLFNIIRCVSFNPFYLGVRTDMQGVQGVLGRGCIPNVR